MRGALLSACVVATVAGGCGGAGGERRMRLTGEAGTSGGGGSGGSAEPKFMCGTSNILDCSRPSMLLPDGHLTDFGPREWTPTSGKWCNEAKFHGSIFGFKGSAATDTFAQSVNAEDGSFRLSLSVSAGSYGGGGIAFESCLDATAFTGLEFTVAIASGSLTGCTYQIQLQTFEQRPTSQNPPGACDMNTATCYGFPARANLPAPSTDITMPTLVSVPFSEFSASEMPAPAQLVGLQWQVNSSGGACTVELRIDDVRFIPAAAPADAGIPDDAGVPVDANVSVDATVPVDASS